MQVPIKYLELHTLKYTSSARTILGKSSRQLFENKYSRGSRALFLTNRYP